MNYDFFNKQFEATDILPHKIAVAGSDTDLTWAEMAQKVAALSAIFSALEIPHGHPVLIYGHKEHLFPVAILACIHCGVTYIPVDKIYPTERIKKIVALTQTQILINCTDEALALDFEVVIDKTLTFQTTKKLDFSGKIYTAAVPIGDILQYIMFTSGSTGEPKGVQITYRSVLTFLGWSRKDFGFTPNDVFMNQAPFTFDVSLCDVLNSFSLGGTLVLSAIETVKVQADFLARIKKYKCSVWVSTPSFIFLFLRHPDFTTKNLPNLRSFIFMGEELPSRTCSILHKNFAQAKTYNAYGPTEATIVTTLVEITPALLARFPALPIGYPMPGCELWIEKVQPTDPTGELVIVGEHVSIGYFQRPDLNGEKFFVRNGQRAFRTGDIAYYEDGMVFYLGRNDDQVKFNGFRIELNEISNVLCEHAAVHDAVAVALRRNNEVKKLIAFVILKDKNMDIDSNTEFKNFLSKKLPYYMLPSDFVLLPDFEYTASHKIDKNKLTENYLAGLGA